MDGLPPPVWYIACIIRRDLVVSKEWLTTAAALIIMVFVYTGGQLVVPADVTHVRIDQSVKIIPIEAFRGHTSLVSVETHDGIEKIEQQAFDRRCKSLRGIQLPGVKIVELLAFRSCHSLTDVEFGNKLETIVDFGNKLETIGGLAFQRCASLFKRLNYQMLQQLNRGNFVIVSS